MSCLIWSKRAENNAVDQIRTEINLSDYGIDIFSLALSGGGIATYDSISELLQRYSNAKMPIAIKANFYGQEFSFACKSLSTADNELNGLSFDAIVRISSLIYRISGALSSPNMLIVVSESIADVPPT